MITEGFCRQRCKTHRDHELPCH